MWTILLFLSFYVKNTMIIANSLSFWRSYFIIYYPFCDFTTILLLISWIIYESIMIIVSWPFVSRTNCLIHYLFAKSFWDHFFASYLWIHFDYHDFTIFHTNSLLFNYHYGELTVNCFRDRSKTPLFLSWFHFFFHYYNGELTLMDNIENLVS